MQVRDLMALLARLNPNADVLIHRDCENYGFGYIDKIKTGVFEVTDYGNDFHEDEVLIVNTAQVKAICIFPEDVERPPSVLPYGGQRQ